MIAQRTLAFICYNDSNNDPHNQDKALAKQLADYLKRNGIDSELKGYSSSNFNANTYQWLVLISSRGIEASPQMTKVVDNALEQVVKRRMKDVLVITTGSSDFSSDMHPKWATIRKYDASDPKGTKGAFDGIFRAMQYAKTPYVEAIAGEQQKQVQQAVPQSLRNWFSPMKIASIAAVLAAFIVLAIVFAFILLTTPHVSTLTSSNLTATAQTVTQALATQTAVAKAQSPSTSPTVGPTKQREYQSITSIKPTISGFRVNEQWSGLADKTCAFDAQNPAVYHAVVQTSEQYIRCMETKTQFKDFALQVTMKIVGDAGGVIFRENDKGIYYRFAFNQSDPNKLTYSVYLCSNGDCDTNVVGSGKELILDTVPKGVDITKPITLTVIAKASNIDLYINSLFLTSLSDTTSLSGQIGVFAAELNTNTDVAFSNLKVWVLGTGTPAQPNNRRQNNRQS